jgi:uncharacterized protein (DUF1501 family)
MQRRDLLKLFASSPLWLSGLPAFAESNPRWDRILVFIELKGANDSLNTIIPYTDPLYYQFRPRLAIPRDKVLPLSEQVGMHPALRPLLPLWESKQLALVHGLGYKNPNPSHFRSIEIWNTGSDSETILRDGWLTRCFTHNPLPQNFSASGISLNDDLGPLNGIKSKAIIMGNPKQFLNRTNNIDVEDAPTDNPALAHILEVQKSIKEASSELFDKFIDENYLSQSPFRSEIDSQLSVVAQLIKNNVANPVYKLSLGNFDTHGNQPPQHQRLLQEFAEAVHHFREQLVRANLWDRVVVITYSEFGRRPQENSNLGTDHGTAASHFVMGGSVIGGHYGQMPALADLEENNLKFTTDYRQLYSTLIEKWWNIAPAQNLFAEFPALALFT